MSLIVKNLTKKFPNIALGPYQLEITSGKIVGVLGTNGSGKSTLFEMITCHMDPDDGWIELNNHRLKRESHDLRKWIGYVPQTPNLPSWSTPNEILNYCAGLLELPNHQQKTQYQIEAWGLQTFLHQPLCTLSYGMLKRISLAIGFIHDPLLLILDEAFTALDISHIAHLKKEILLRKEKNKITILSTHVMSYAVELCHDIYLIKKGQSILLPKTVWQNDISGMALEKACLA